MDRLDRADQLSILAMYLFVLTSLFFPTSWNGEIHSELIVTTFSLQIGFLCVIAIRRGMSLRGLIYLIAALTLLTAFTLLSQRQEYAWGAALLYATPLFMFAVNLPADHVGRFGRGYFILLFLTLNIALLSLGIAIAADIDFAKALTRAMYSAFYEELYEQMVEWFNKPVTVFATHSVAAFASFVLFVANLFVFTGRRQLLFLVLALAHLVILVLLRSLSGIGFLALALIILTGLTRGFTRILTLGALVAVLVAVLQITSYFPTPWSVLTSSEGGFLGRYGEGAPLGRTIGYMIDHPFKPIGFEYNQDLFYGDSGIVEYLLRGSLPLLLVMYLALWWFLTRYVDDIKIRIGIFLTIVLFESGFSILTYYRTTGLLVLLCLAYGCSKASTESRFSAQN